MADDDNDSIQSVSPAQQCLFWSLTAAFMVKLTCLVVVAVSIHNNDWITVEPDVLRHTFVRGISFDDCAYNLENPGHIECIKWSLINKTEWMTFWSNHGVNHENVISPSAWYSNAYYICLLLLVWYLLDMGAMLIICCRQKQPEDTIAYQKQISVLSSIFIILTYFSIYLGVIHAQQRDFVHTQFPAKSTTGIGAKLFLGTLAGYIFACLIQHAYYLYNCRDSLTNPRLLIKGAQSLFRDLFPRSQERTATNRSGQPQEVEMQRLKR